MGDSDDSLTVMLSANWGRTWKKMGMVYKPHYTADFIEFHMEPGGKGYVVFAMDSEFEEKKKTSAVTVYNKSHTGDLGNTWELEDGPFIEDTNYPIEKSGPYCSHTSDLASMQHADPECRIDFAAPY